MWWGSRLEALTAGPALCARKLRSTFVVFMLAALTALAAPAGSGAAESPATGLEPAPFADPGPNSRPATLWFWSGTITRELIDQQLATMRAEGSREVVIFAYGSSPGFFTEEWFDLVGHALEEARRTGMRVWLFNDDHFPSGRANGLVVNGGRVGDRTYEAHPELRSKELVRATRTIQGPGPVDVSGLWPGFAPPSALTVESGRLRVEGGEINVLNHGYDWRDYTLSADVKLLETGGGGSYGQAGWVVRAGPENRGYVLLLSNTGPTRGRLTRIAGDGSVVHRDLSFAVDPARWYRVDTRVEGDRIETSVDGQVVDSFQDATFAMGTVGVREFDTESALFDNVRVTAADGNVLYAESFDSYDALRAFSPESQIPGDRVIAVSALPVHADESQLDGSVDLTEQFRSGANWTAPSGEYRIEYFTSIPRRYDYALGGFDLLSGEAAARFVDSIHGEYYRRFPWAFGTVLKGFWDDEPVVTVSDDIPWSPDLKAELGRFGSSLAQTLPALFADYGRHGRLARGRFWRAVGTQLADTYYRTQGRWARAHGVAMISNPLSDDAGPSSSIGGAGSILLNHQWFQVPGGDAISQQVVPGRRSLAARYAASSGHQNGRARVMSENLGAYGWGVTPELARFVNGYLAVRGVNLTVQHAYWSNPDNVPYPPPLDPSNTWWDAMDAVTSWTGRVMEANLGRAAAQTAVLLPRRAAEAWYRSQTQPRIDSGLSDVAFALEDVQVDFDMLDEASVDGDPAMRLQASPRGGALRIDRQRYRVVVLPPAPTMSLETVERLRSLVESGGAVFAYGQLPTEETDGHDAALRDAVAALFGADPVDPQPVERRVGAGRVAFTRSLADLQRLAEGAEAPAATLSPQSNQVRILRRVRGDDLVFLVMNEGANRVETTATFPVSGTPELWDPDDGSHETATRFFATRTTTAVPLRLEAFEVAVVAFRKGAPQVAQVPHLVSSKLSAREVRAVDDRALEATMVAETPGEFELLGTHGGRFYRGKVEVDDPLTPIPLGGVSRFRFDRPGSGWLERPLSSWTELDPSYSGQGVYEKAIALSEDDLAAGRRLLLDLGEVRDVVEVEVNGRPVGRLAWRPYRIDVTEALRPGDNTITARVTNTPANAHGSAQSSGLLGPVQLRPIRQVQARLDHDPAAVATGKAVVLSTSAAHVQLAPCDRTTVSATVENFSPRPVEGELTASIDPPLETSPSRAAIRVAGGGKQTVAFDVFALPGVESGDYQARLSFNGATTKVGIDVPSGTNLARAGEASASSTHPSFTVAGAINGNRDSDDWANGNGWNDNTLGQFPDWLQVNLACTTPVGRVDLYTLDSAQYPASQWGLRDADIELLVDGAWRTVAEVRNNSAGMVRRTFTPVAANAIRVVVLAANDGAHSRVVELEAFAR